MKHNLDTMTKGELRAYAIAHPDDRSAFHTGDTNGCPD
jgi:hypothetical protein